MWFSITAVQTTTNLVASKKKKKFIILQFYRLKVQHGSHWAKINMWAGFFLSGGSRENLFSSLSSF